MAIKIADAFIEILLDYSKAQKDAQNMDKSIMGLTSGTVAKLGAAMTATGAVITGSLGVAAAQAGEFGKNLANVSTLGVKDLDALDTGTRDLAVRYGIDLNEAMQSTYETISAGIPEDAAIMVMEQAARGAQAGVGSLADALDLGTSVMNAWNIKGKDAAGTAAEMEKIMGMAATAAFKGKTTFADMATSIGQVAPVMSAAGVGTDEFFAAVSALTATGKPTSSAMTQLQQAVSNVIKPSEEAKKMAASLGLEFDAQALSSKGLAGFLDSVKQATGGNVEQMGILFGSVEALGAAISLTGNQSGIFKESLDEMANAQKNVAEMAANFEKNNPAIALARFKSALQNFAIELGRTVLPALGALARAVTPILQWITTLMHDHPVIAGILGTTAGGIGVLATAIGGLALIISGMMPAIGLLTGATGLGGVAAAATGAGTAAAAAAGAGGLGALSAGLVATGAAALPVIGLLAVIGVTAAATVPTIMSTAKAYLDLATSNKAVYDQTMEYVALLQRQGVELDADALKHMSYANQQETINAAVIASRENAAAREIQAITGVDATRQQIHIAELARVGLGVSAQQAAAMAVQGITQAQIQDMMAKGAVEQQLAAQSVQTKSQAAAASAQFEIDGRTDKTATIGVFQWAADKEAAMLAKAAELKSADYYRRKQIMADLAAMEAEKAAAERQWANQNQALTASEIAGMQYKVQAKEQADARYIAIAEGTMKSEKDQLYVNLSDQVATIKVHGDAITRQKAWEAEQRKKEAEKLAKVEGDLEDKIGKKKLDALNESIKKVQEQGDFEKLNATQVAQFKEQVLKGDLDTSMKYWAQLREQANVGYVTSLDQYKAFTSQMKAEAASMRQALAYAMNPAQTGSPSLNQEMALGFVQSQQIAANYMNQSLRDISQYGQIAKQILLGLGMGMIGPSQAPTATDMAPVSGGGNLSGSGNTASGSQASITNNITINAPGGNATEIASKVKSTIGQEMAKHVRKMARAQGVRSPGLHRVPTIPGTA